MRTAGYGTARVSLCVHQNCIAKVRHVLCGAYHSWSSGSTNRISLGAWASASAIQRLIQ